MGFFQNLSKIMRMDVLSLVISGFYISENAPQKAAQKTIHAFLNVIGDMLILAPNAYFQSRNGL